MIRAAARRLMLVLSAGYILMYFSEHLFWARFRPGIDGPANYLATWAAYSLAGYAALAVISAFMARRPEAVFLAGAVFGWLVEGVIVGTAYESLPLSISFTGLAWHAAISLCAGLWLIPAVLSRRDFLILPVAVLTGLLFGLWGMNWNANPAEYHASAAEFFLYAAVTGVLLVVALGVFCALRASPVRMHPAEGAVLFWLAAFFFVVRAVEQPIAACILPVLMGMTFFALRRNRRKESAGSLLERPLARVSARSLAALLLIPFSAAAVYVPSVRLGWNIPTNVGFYLILTPMGFILYFASWVRILRDRRGSEKAAASRENRPPGDCLPVQITPGQARGMRRSHTVESARS
jgi:hypothetical protein